MSRANILWVATSLCLAALTLLPSYALAQAHTVTVAFGRRPSYLEIHRQLNPMSRLTPDVDARVKFEGGLKCKVVFIALDRVGAETNRREFTGDKDSIDVLNIIDLGYETTWRIELSVERSPSHWEPMKIRTEERRGEACGPFPVPRFMTIRGEDGIDDNYTDAVVNIRWAE